jgi:hypothetical protein
MLRKAIDRFRRRHERKQQEARLEIQADAAPIVAEVDKTDRSLRGLIERALAGGRRGKAKPVGPQELALMNRAERRELRRARRKRGRGYTHQHGQGRVRRSEHVTQCGDPGRIAPRHEVKKGYVPTAARRVLVRNGELDPAVKKSQRRELQEVVHG